MRGPISSIQGRSPPTRRAQAARLAHRNTNSLGYRCQRPDGDGGGQSRINVDPANVAIITRDQVRHAKPDPDLFLAAATVSMSPSKGRLWSGTVFEICSRQRGA